MSVLEKRVRVESAEAGREPVTVYLFGTIPSFSTVSFSKITTNFLLFEFALKCQHDL